MLQEKKLCITHHLYYRGSQCPICKEEHIGGLIRKYCPQKENVVRVETSTKDREINENDIMKLMEKFNTKISLKH